jgi:hypothetical protein
METWFLDNSDRIYRFVVYKKLFTPYEQDKKFMDESQFVDTHYRFGFIEEAIELGNGEWLLGFREVVEEEVRGYISYFKLSDIQLSYFEQDQNMLSQSEDET